MGAGPGAGGPRRARAGTCALAALVCDLRARRPRRRSRGAVAGEEQLRGAAGPAEVINKDNERDLAAAPRVTSHSVAQIAERATNGPHVSESLVRGDK